MCLEFTKEFTNNGITHISDFSATLSANANASEAAESVVTIVSRIYTRQGMRNVEIGMCKKHIHAMCL